MQSNNNKINITYRKSKTEIEQMKLDGAISTLENYPTDLNIISQQLDDIWTLAHRLQEQLTTANRELIKTVDTLTKNIQEVEDNL
tara:strand:+ start:2662 stop:2916 length:255 start_codon:yes stop_codon:yes gene_type:complete